MTKLELSTEIEKCQRRINDLQRKNTILRQDLKNQENLEGRQIALESSVAGISRELDSSEEIRRLQEAEISLLKEAIIKLTLKDL